MTTKNQELAVLAALMVKYGIKGQVAPKAKVSAAKPAPKAQAKPSAWDVEAAAVKAAEKAGFVGAKPRVDLLTASKWAEAGFRPKAGTKAIRVKKPGSAGKGLPLFHKEQVELAA
jgi:hypothetical protein